MRSFLFYSWSRLNRLMRGVDIPQTTQHAVLAALNKIIKLTASQMISKHPNVAISKINLKGKNNACLHLPNVQRDLNPIFIKCLPVLQKAAQITTMLLATHILKWTKESTIRSNGASCYWTRLDSIADLISMLTKN